MSMPVKLNFRGWALVLGLLALALAGTAQSASKDEQAIREVMRQEIEYWNAGNIEGYVSLYAPDDSVRMLWSTGSVYGRDNILGFYKKYWPKDRMGQLMFSDVRIERISDDYYFTQGFFHVTYPNAPEQKAVNGRFSGLMKKINGRWYLYTDHSG